MWVKSKFVLCQPRHYHLLTVKNNKKVHVFEELIFFKNLQVPSISKNSFQTPSLDNTVLGNFTLSNAIISVEDLIR